ncbi:hypothetical protein N8T08_004637 [Aspergillus melleus]|uniref:Uncharacterized protein n=1 Tax=Aspergillus melleus TaxID=138277 RepID=A0ACC3B4D1_9EURO|nr:hypothetical protein N8T08_004637 [Aspergillus melleus]
MLREILLQVQGQLTAPTAVAMGAYVDDIFLIELLLAAGIQPVKDSLLVHTLICHGANVNPTGTTLTPLQRAVENNDPEIVKVIIDAGADINAPPPASPGANALQIAVKAGNVELIDILLAAGADIDANHGATALQFAAIMGYISIVYRLAAAGANVNAPRAIFYGRTALEGAAEYGRLDMLQVLLNEGAHFTGQFRTQYVRAVKLAEYNGHFAAAKLLRLTGGWSDPDSAQYENEVFDRQEVERFKQMNCRQIEGSDPSIIGSKRSFVKELQTKGRSDGDGLTRHLSTHMGGQTQKWWDCIDQLINANT